MTAPSDIACVLLAAGEARRFGGAKLTTELGGIPLGLYAARAMTALPFGARIAVCGAGTPDFSSAGFEQVPVPTGVPALSASIRAGVAAALARGTKAVLLALADMPLVPASHFAALVGQFDGARIATRVGETVQPPAVLGSQFFEGLLALTGDRGAKSLLNGAPAVELPAEWALDIDTREDLRRAGAILEAQALAKPGGSS